MSYTRLKDSHVIKIDGAYLYKFGSQMRPLLDIPETERSKGEMYFPASTARSALNEFMLQSVFRQELVAVEKDAQDLEEELAKYDGDIFEMFDSEEKISEWQVRKLKESYRKFVNVLDATFRLSTMYYVSPKGGYNTQYLTEAGDYMFPSDLSQKVPDAISDVKQATRCIAFELPTAAGFHLHRANESVLRAYWDVVTGGEPRPNDGNMGVYLAELNRLNKGKKAVREHLKSIKDFHRNPLMHPDQSLDTVDEAISLMAAIRCSIGYMLAEIPNSDPLLLPSS